MSTPFMDAILGKRCPVCHVRLKSREHDNRHALVEALLADESRKPKESDLLSVWVDEFTKDGTGPLASVDALQHFKQLQQLFEPPKPSFQPTNLSGKAGLSGKAVVNFGANNDAHFLMASGVTNIPVKSKASVNAALKNAINQMQADLENVMLSGGGGGGGGGAGIPQSTFIVGGGGGGWEPQGITFEPGDSGLSSVMSDIGFSASSLTPIRTIVSKHKAEAEEPKVEAEPGVRQIDLE